MATSFGPHQRQLLEGTASRLYANAVHHGHVKVDDPRIQEGGDFHDALHLLLDLGLLTVDEADRRYLPVDPTSIQSRVVVPLGRQGADLLQESARWAAAFDELGQTYRRNPHGAAAPITEIRGLDQIDSFLQAIIGDARTELLTAQPYGRRPADDLARAENRDVRALQRGVRMRTLYQHSARQSPATREYVAEITAHGAGVRTLDEFFKRLIIVDREVAVIPGSEDHAVALALRDKSLVAYLVDIFDRSWERATPFTATDARADRSIAADVRAMTIRLLVEGHSDPASAKRLGVSTRTYAGYIASLKEEYGVQTRFQLGHAMGRTSVNRNRPDDHDDYENPDSFPET